jgi:cyclic pyranopterin phosphate synthase
MNAVPDTDELPRDTLGRSLHDLRLSVIEACNFRCPYCMPAERVPEDYGLDAVSRLSFDEIERLVRGFVRLGVRKLRLTGGEPLLRKRLPELIARLAAIDGIDDIALTTNGSLLAPQANALRDAGLQRVTISLDTLDPSQFAALSGGRGDLVGVLRGIEAARSAGFARIKLNCVVQRGVNEDQVVPLVEFAREHGHTLRFIEYMDVGTCNDWNVERVVPSSELRDIIHEHWPLHAVGAQYRGEVASRHAFDDGCGEVGFVSSISAPFCGDCHRARVSADGRLYTCLFAGTGVDLRPWLDDERAFVERLTGLWRARGDRYSELRSGHSKPMKRVEMYLVGG